MRTALCVVLLLAAPVLAEPTLIGLARLPADTFRDGPTSGQFIEAEGAPFVDKQPVGGISSLVPIPGEPGSYYALSDNGFGTKANSADYLLCVYKITPDFETGEVAWELAFHLSDPNDLIDWPTVADGETYPAPHGSDIPVPAMIRDNRLLTGADFDVESMVLLPDGTIWIGDEFGPFLLHFDDEGRLLEEPVGLPGEGMHSPDHPTKDPAMAKIGRSSGFEGLAAVRNGTLDLTKLPEHLQEQLSEQELRDLRAWAATVRVDALVALLEKPMEGEQDIRIYRLQLGTSYRPKADVNEAFKTISLSESTSAVGGATWFSAPPMLLAEATVDFLYITRDAEQGDDSRGKRLRVFSILTSSPGGPDAVTRGDAADLLDLADPDDLDGDGNNRFRFPYLTIESVAVVDERTVIVCNDNNFPFTDGRPEREGPDETEFILIRFDEPLADLAAGVETND